MRDAIPYGSHTRLRDRREHEQVVFERQSKRIQIETTDSATSTSTSGPTDRRRLRGIPALAQGVCGEMSGTRPDKVNW